MLEFIAVIALGCAGAIGYGLWKARNYEPPISYEYREVWDTEQERFIEHVKPVKRS
jgi:hypothetical protein